MAHLSGVWLGSAAGMATAVFRSLPPLAGGKADSAPSFWVSLHPPPPVSLLLTTRGSLSRPAHPVHSSLSDPLHPPHSCGPALSAHRPSFSHSRTYPVLGSPSPAMLAASPSLPAPVNSWSDPLSSSAKHCFHFPTPRQRCGSTLTCRKTRSIPVTPTLSQTPSELDSASPRNPSLSQSCVDSVVCCRPLHSIPQAPPLLFLSSPARPSCFSLLRTPRFASTAELNCVFF